jgi:hypothetical protein
LQVKEKLVDVPLQEAEAKEIRISFQQIAADRYDNWQPFSDFRAAQKLHFCPKYQVSIKGPAPRAAGFWESKAAINRTSHLGQRFLSAGKIGSWLSTGLFRVTSMPQAIDGPFVRSLLDLKGQMRSEQDLPLRTNLL